MLILVHAALFGGPKRCRRLANKGWALASENSFAISVDDDV